MMICLSCKTRSALPDTVICDNCHKKLRASQICFYRRVRKVLDMIDDWKSASEIALNVPCSKATARKILNLLVENGLAEKKVVLKWTWTTVYRRRK